jgi:tetratricopeptide (TPR) repeat protein
MVGDYPKAISLLEDTTRGAVERGDQATQAVAAAVRATVASQTGGPDMPIEKAMEVADQAAAVLGQIGNHEQLAQVLHLAAGFHGGVGRADEASLLEQSGLDHARSAGDLYLARACLGGLLGAKCWGSTSVSEFFAYRDGISAELQPLLAGSRFYSALMAAYSGDFSTADREYAEAQRFAARFANPVVVAALTMYRGIIELLEDVPSAAEPTLRDGYQRLDTLGAQGLGVTCATFLAEALLRQGRAHEAIELLDLVDEVAQTDDFDPQVRSRSVRARIYARDGRLHEADRLSHEALDIIAATDAIVLHGETLVTRAEVLLAQGCAEDSETALRQALKLFERKENVVEANQTRELLAALRVPQSGAPSPRGHAVPND